MFQIFVGFEHGREWWLELCLTKKKKKKKRKKEKRRE